MVDLQLSNLKKTVCKENSCWGQLGNIHIGQPSKVNDFGAFGLESVERRIFQTFFSVYKHHATPQSCCREWFTFQLNKMSTFLLSKGKLSGQKKT